MEYQPPYGSIDPDAPYVDRNTPDAVQGSKVPAKAVEHPQREIVAVIEAADLVPSEDDTTQLLQALQFFFAQFPIYPECLNSNNTFDVSSPSAGTIRIPAGIAWVMRGATRYQTDANVDLSTLSNKTYHLRWDRANGFRLRDLADTAYNPTAATEDNEGFDSTYDDMLVARVVTNGANVATIANLKNLARFVFQVNRRDALANQLNWGPLPDSGVLLNWARTPDVVNFGMNEWRSNTGDPDGSATPAPAGSARAIGGKVVSYTRYKIDPLQYYYEDDTLTNGMASWILLVMAL